jgi:hypothetical protein
MTFQETLTLSNSKENKNKREEHQDSKTRKEITTPGEEFFLVLT